MNRRDKVIVGSFIVAAVAAFVAIWWWALLGMTDEVGAASGLTVSALVVVAIMSPLWTEIL